MALPHVSSSPTGSARTHADRSGPVDVSASEMALLRRRDVGLYPLVLISIGSFALALSQALRPAGQESVTWANPVIIIGSLIFGVVVGAFAASQELGIGRRFLGSLWFYFVGAGVLLIGLATVAILDVGIKSVGYSAVVLVASYAGFVFPRLWSRVSVLGLLALTAAIQLVRPGADLLEAGTVFALIVVGWIIGLLPRFGHRGASWQALLMSRSDALTGVLNRRGLLEQFAYALQTANEAREPISLVIIDLNGFKQINDREGHAAGDELLSWVGRTVPGVLPPGAIFGRLGGDEFAVVLPGLGGAAAELKAHDIHSAIAERIGASVGVSSDAAGVADEEALMQAADQALYRAKADPAARVQFAPAVALPSIPGEGPRGRIRRPVLTYDQLRASGEAPSALGAAVFDGRWMVAGFGMIALAGIPIVFDAMVFGGHTFYEEMLRYLGIPWVLANLAVGVSYRNYRMFVDPPRFPWVMSAVLVGSGVGTAALATGDGVTAPIMAAFFIKVLFDGSMARQRMALQNFAIMAGYWAVVVALGPRDALWAAPYGLMLLVGGHILGAMGRNAFESARRARVRIASTDALTDLLNRRGFETLAQECLVRAAADEITLALITFDLDDFKGVNDTQGHAAGDQLLRAVAHLTRDALGDAYGIGRIGGDEFVALVPVPSIAALHGQVSELDSGLAVLVGGSIGSAIFGDDGTTFEALLAVADARAYAVKRSRHERARAERSGDAEPDAVA